MRHSILLLVLALTVSPALASAPTTRPAAPGGLPELIFKDTPLAQAIDLLRDATDANITVNWKALELAGIGKDIPVNLQLRDVTLRKALSLILNTATDKKAAYTIEDNVIEITTKELADSRLLTRVYDIRDLLVEIPDFQGPDLSLTSAQNSSAKGGGGGSIFNSTSRDSAKTTTKKERAEALIQNITETVRPEIWKDNGGPATIRHFNGHIIVTAPRSIHEAIAGMFN